MFPLLRTALVIPLFAVGLSVRAQIPTKCLEIERILVDACIDQALCPGSTEGQNEMVGFRTGPQVTALTDLVANWPNNSWNGLVQNGTTAGITSTLNATITACGHLLEPPGGLIPPGSRVVLVTSTAVCTQANPFTNLTDTVYLIFQAPGNSVGHFANHNNGGLITPVPSGAPSLRTLVLMYLPTNCSDTATYDRSLLVNTLGTYGGTTADNDGATAVFSWPGVPQVTYVNFGCQAPFAPNLVTIEDVVDILCSGNGSVDLNASTVGPFTGALWSGGTGTFSDPTSLTPTYTVGANDLGEVVLSITATFTCGVPVTASITIPISDAPVVTLTPDGPTTICPGEDVVLTASGANSYVWSNQATTASITVTQGGTYTVNGTNACGSVPAQITITQASVPTVTITPDGPTNLCPGEDVVLTASGADSYVWSNQATTASITVTQVGAYNVNGTNGCGSASAQITITQAPGPIVTITADGPTTICPGEDVVLTASGADSYVWSDQSITPSISITQAGTYSVTGTTTCGTGTAQITITVMNVPSVIITPDGPTALCVGEDMVLSANGADSYVWSNLAITPSITVTQAGTYSVTGTNMCGTSAAQIIITTAFGPAVSITANGPTTFCYGGEVTLTATGADNFVWSDLSTGSSITVEQTGNYSVTGINDCGTSTADQHVEVTIVTAAFTARQLPCTPLVEIVLASTADSCAFFIGDSLVTHACSGFLHWDFGRDNTYDFTLYATDASHCADTLAVTIDVRSVPTLFLANAFTPNDDGINDRWPDRVEIPGTGFELNLFDRWGASVWSTTNPLEQWDGDGLPVDVYVYTMRMRDPCVPTNEITRTGHVSLVR
ncbi:MAG: gliding motility-associated C-terminal domain-containing protein [Flavobacteriales bacterium]|nr:gliding motility-associated C-terminal domain-containing protein [Flavobacteriales bacterium]